MIDWNAIRRVPEQPAPLPAPSAAVPLPATGEETDDREPLIAGSMRRDDRSRETLMPLLDHFHFPVERRAGLGNRFRPSGQWRWWRRLNRIILPPGYYAETQMHIGGRVEVDVGSFEQEP